MADQLFVFDQASMLALRRDHARMKGILTELQQRVATLQHSGPAAPFLIGKVDSDIAAGASGEISIWGLRAGVDADLGYNLTAYDWTLGGATAGDQVHLWRHQQSGRIYFSAGGGEEITVVTDVTWDEETCEMTKTTAVIRAVVVPP